MPSVSKAAAAALSGSPPQTEKPTHYRYLKEFRTEQCSLFVQHKCTQHRPFTCFHWHFLNQRRRRPLRRRDGTFNYSPDVYCSKYDEASGLCPDGDECPYLHRTTGDTERKYHLRYYKTGTCIHETDARGHCVKNGLHCAFAHGPLDLRPPVCDIRELQAQEALQNGQLSAGDGVPDLQPGVLASQALMEKILGEDPRWQDTNFVLGSYKTEQCPKPPRLCRQGYACPHFHNSRDRRRDPRRFQYRSTPCPSVKHGDEWGEPSRCESGDSCQYCHSRTEQQFHPEIYKSTKCNDMRQTGHCPRGPFCAFAHVEKSLGMASDWGCRDLTSTSGPVAPSGQPGHAKRRDSPAEGSQKASEQDSKQSHLAVLAVGHPLAPSVSSSLASSLASSTGSGGSSPTALPTVSARAHPLDPTGSAVEAVPGSSLDLHLGDISLVPPDKDLEEHDSRDLGPTGLNGVPGSIWDFVSGSFSPSPSPILNAGPTAPSGASPNSAELARVRRQLEEAKRKIRQWEESWQQVKQACDAWQREAKEAKERALAADSARQLALQKKDEVEAQFRRLQEELEGRGLASMLPGLRGCGDISAIPLPKLHSLQSQLRLDLEAVDGVSPGLVFKALEGVHGGGGEPAEQLPSTPTFASSWRPCPRGQGPCRLTRLEVWWCLGHLPGSPSRVPGHPLAWCSVKAAALSLVGKSFHTRAFC
ncbi:putative E3 ubiquitin-protein ligase UNKL isoform X4 [Lagenorhynchus albirostris]|uniref:putative E3 ubiquitin-protein ligase UNKL isoform X4 n=1 Tax=Lagenorhynchus albirostris TaxID=27610 RepID=UPI00122EE4CF|nr:putative E3 ubiquitin-protein ligase UNKL isoform X5 [Globicephala melas]XP_059979893.1 putative E3 ubiquitin-protein ligase UNKL isoform X4 [Lagenorhynchus albirostris]